MLVCFYASEFSLFLFWNEVATLCGVFDVKVNSLNSTIQKRKKKNVKEFNWMPGATFTFVTIPKKELYI